MIELTKTHTETVLWQPLEAGAIRADRGAELAVSDGDDNLYFRRRIARSRAVKFRARGAAGRHRVMLLDGDGELLDVRTFLLRPHTFIRCNRGPYGRLELRLRNLMTCLGEQRSHVVSERFYQLLVCWLRDHTYVLKAQKYHVLDVKSGVEFFLERQQPNGMIWDDVHPNTAGPGRHSIFGEALGEGFHAYEEGMKWVLRRIPVEADVEYLLVEGVWHAWKASGDDAWLAAQMPRLAAAVAYMTGDPLRWSAKHGLVKRGYTMDSWDFANPHFQKGDHRCVDAGAPMFLFHGDNSGCYAAMWRMAEMCDALGDTPRAKHWRREAATLRRRANRKLWKDPCYAHMVPERPLRGLKRLVGDDDRRMSLSTGYTINRGLPTHEMAVKILREYRRRGRTLRSSSFAEWWTMDPMYTKAQWPANGPPPGEYMNGAISPLVAGELAHAAFQHGMEAYGADVLRRLWALSERDGGELADCYRRIGPGPEDAPKARFRSVDLRGQANVGLRHRARKGVVAWTDEGDNDLRELPTGRQTFQGARFDVIDPASNAGRAVVCLSAEPATHMPAEVTVPAGPLKAKSVYFLHARAYASAGTVAVYDVLYADGLSERIYVNHGREIGNWWGIAPLTRRKGGGDTSLARVAWQGANPTFGNVGLYVYGWNNPHPRKAIAGFRLAAATRHKVMIAAVSTSNRPVAYPRGIRSYGLPETWAQGAVYYAVAEGLAGVQDTGRAFSRVKLSPRWLATEAGSADVCLHYPASDGYCAYRLSRQDARRRIRIDVTGSFSAADVHCLLPPGAKARRVRVAGRDVPFENTRVEKSRYVDFVVAGPAGGVVLIDY